MPREALVGDLVGSDLRRREQGRGAVADIVMGVPLGAARADVQARLGTLQRLDLRFSSTQTTIARSGVRPVGEPEALGRWAQRGGQDLGPAITADGLGPPRAGLVTHSVQAALAVATPPQQHDRARAANLAGDLGVGQPLGRQQQDSGPLRQCSPDRVRPAPLTKGVLIF
jgi:hypothetical protein